MYEWQRQRLQMLCEWLLPEPVAARGLFLAVLLETWRQSEDLWISGGSACVARGLAQHFRWMFPPKLRPEQETFHAGRAGAKDTVRSAVYELPLPWRLVYLLHDVEHYPVGVLAGWLEFGVPECGAMIHQARLHLRQRLLEARSAA